MTKPPGDPSLRNEPFYTGGYAAPSAQEEPALNPVAYRTSEEPGLSSVWDEPAILASQSPPPDAISYAHWYRRGIERTTLLQSQSALIGLALLGGPFAVFSALFFAPPQSASGMLAVVVIAPVIEEMLKIGAVLIALERRPYLFLSSVQIFLGVVCSALCFAVIENVLYLNLYISAPGDRVILWRWTVCVAMHVSATAISGLGVARAWAISRQSLARPDIKAAMPMLWLAMCLHGGYNFFATLFDGWFQ